MLSCSNLPADDIVDVIVSGGGGVIAAYRTAKSPPSPIFTGGMALPPVLGADEPPPNPIMSIWCSRLLPHTESGWKR